MAGLDQRASGRGHRTGTSHPTIQYFQLLQPLRRSRMQFCLSYIGAVGLIVSTLWLNVMRTLLHTMAELLVLRQLTQSTSEEQWQAVASLPQLGTTVQIGRLCSKERALVNRTLMRWIPGCPRMGGSSSQPRPWSNVTRPLSCSRALLRSQSGPMSGLPFSSVPSSPPTRFAPQLFRVLLLRRLWLALPLPSHLPVFAVHSTSLATTAQRVRERESWGVGVLLEKRSGTGLP